MTLIPPDKPVVLGRLLASVSALGYAGLIPFAVLAAALWLGPQEHLSFVRLALLSYGATIASFLGAIHWGLAMRDVGARRVAPYVWGVLPSLVAWGALLAPPVVGLLVMAMLLVVCFGVDRRTYPGYGLSHWLPMRLVLTLLASASCVLGAAA